MQPSSPPPRRSRGRPRSRTALLAVAGALASLTACEGTPAEPSSEIELTPDPVVKALLSDPWTASFLDLDDAELGRSLEESTSSAAFGRTLETHLAASDALSPDDAIALTVLDLAITAARIRTDSSEDAP